MFSFFGKPPSTRKTTELCLEAWRMLSDKDKATCAKNILAMSRTNKASNADFQLELSDYKQAFIKQFNIKNHMHPAFMQVQILMDILFVNQPDQAAYASTVDAFKLITNTLTNDEKLELQKNLSPFITLKDFAKSPTNVKPSESYKAILERQTAGNPSNLKSGVVSGKKWKHSQGGLVNNITGEAIPARYLKRVENPVTGYEITAYNYSTVWIRTSEIED